MTDIDQASPYRNPELLEKRKSGSFVLGIVAACVGALIGAAVWAVVAVFLHIEIGYLAILIGFLAGLGGLKFAGEPSAKLGEAVSIVAIAGIWMGGYASFVAQVYGSDFEEDMR